MNAQRLPMRWGVFKLSCSLWLNKMIALAKCCYCLLCPIRTLQTTAKEWTLFWLIDKPPLHSHPFIGDTGLRKHWSCFDLETPLFIPTHAGLTFLNRVPLFSMNYWYDPHKSVQSDSTTLTGVFGHCLINTREVSGFCLSSYRARINQTPAWHLKQWEPSSSLSQNEEMNSLSVVLRYFSTCLVNTALLLDQTL